MTLSPALSSSSSLFYEALCRAEECFQALSFPRLSPDPYSSFGIIFKLFYHTARYKCVTKQKKVDRIFSAHSSGILKHCQSFLCPAVLHHIFTVKFRLSGFKISKIIALYKACINTVAGRFVTQNVFCPYRLQGVF